MFAEGYPLGKRGLQWLKMHLINLHGEKKKCLIFNAYRKHMLPVTEEVNLQYSPLLQGTIAGES